MSDLSTYAGQAEHYAAVRVRLGMVSPPSRVRICRAQPVIDLPPEPEPPFQAIRILAIEELPKDTVLVPIPSWKRIAREVAKKYDVTVREMTGPWRNARFVIARHEAMYRCWQELDLSFPVIGRLFGGRDHTTALNAVRRHQTRMGLEARGLSVTGTQFLLTPERFAQARALRANGKTWVEIGKMYDTSGKTVSAAVARELDRLDNDKRLAA